MISKAEVSTRHFGTTKFLAAQKRLREMEGLQSIQTLKNFTLKLPYQASGPFDRPLPTLADILNGSIIGEQKDKVYRVSEIYAVKESRSWSIICEAENLLYLQSHSQVRTPRLYAVFQANDMYYMIMEYIPGVQFWEAWTSLEWPERTRACEMLAEQLRLLRATPATEKCTHYGRVNGQSYAAVQLIPCSSTSEPCGPYHSPAEFITALYTTAEIRASKASFSPEFHPTEIMCFEHFEYSFLNAGNNEDWKPTLSHLDLKLSNILCKVTSGRVESVSIIDWASMAWFPAFVEPTTIQTQAYFEDMQDTYRFQHLVSSGFDTINLALVELLGSVQATLGFTI